MKTQENEASAFSMYRKPTSQKTTKKQHKNKSKTKENISSNKRASVFPLKKKTPAIVKKVNSVSTLNELSIPVELPALKSLKNKKASGTKKSLKTQTTKKAILPIEKINFYEKPKLTFEWLISPISLQDFFETWWEKSSVYINRGCSDYYQELLTTEILDNIIRSNSLFYTQNVDVVSYENGKRETHNLEGLVYPAVLWDYYANKCSIRVLNPHTYCKKLHSLLSALQEFFGGMVGVNAYLTPKGSQGFAPHYDDIEAFVLQLEGRKHWKLYQPLTPSEVLPRYSSKNFDRNELGKPMKEITLQAGDLLYFPRGIIHEGFTDEDSHSLHITVSVYQKTAYIDLLEHALKSALVTATRLNPEYRKGLPLEYLKHTGYINSQATTNIRDEIVQNVKSLITKLTDYVSVDSAADELGKQFMWDAMPPVPSEVEKTCMVHKNSEKLRKGIVCNQVSITLDVKVRLLRYHCLRIVADEENEKTVHVYYCTENAKYYHGFEQQSLDLDISLVPALEHLVQSYPKYIQVKNLPIDDDDSKMQLVSDLWEHGLVVTEKPLETS